MEINQHEWLYSKLIREKEDPEYRELIDKWEGLPKRTILRKTYVGGSKPVGIAIHEIGLGTNSHVYVLIHGILSDYMTWRYVAAALPSGSDLWIIDLPGHGESDKPSLESLGPGGYAPDAVTERILQALEQQIEARPSPPRITLVAHSLGGMVALRMLSSPEIRNRHEGCLRQVDEAVLFAPADVRVVVKLLPLVTVAELSRTKVLLGEIFGIVRDKVAATVRNGFYHAERATRETTDLRLKAITTPETLGASQAMVIEAVPGWATKGQPDRAEIKKLEENYRNVAVPCRIVWGEWDETLPEQWGHKLKDHIPGADLRELPDCMHSAPLECPKKCADLISAFHAEHRPLVGKGELSAK